MISWTTRKHWLSAYHMNADLTPDSVREPPDESSADPSGNALWRRELRQSVLARRMALSGEDCAQRSQLICQHLREHFPQLAGMRVGFCWPMKNEPDLRPLLEHWRAAGSAGFTPLLPVVVKNDCALAFCAWSPDTPMTHDRFGIPTPAAGDFLQPQALLIPLVAFDCAGYRLGYGGGFFDRTLSVLQPRPLCIGVGFELSRVDSIRPQAHDERLDAVVTEAGAFTFA